jgi:glutamate decarboxylase
VSDTIATPYSSRYGCTEDIPKDTIPEDGIHPNAAYQLIHDELDFDGKPNLNVASFVNTYMVLSLS